MLREANRILKLGTSETMDLAQNLFEAGLITYHRTDSHRVSDAGLRVARMFLGEKFRPRVWEKGGAHECIRPTKPMALDDLIRYVEEGILRPQVNLTRGHLRLYDLIFRRFMASMSEEARLRKQKVRIFIEGASVDLERYVEAIVPGWTFIYPYKVRIEKPLKEEVLVRIEHRKISKVPSTLKGKLLQS